MPLTIPSIDMIEIGAGGGSIACGRRARPAQGRAAQRRLAARARPATAAAAPSRRSPTPTWCWACWTPTISSAATCRWTSRRPRRRSTGWPTSWAPTRAQTAGGIYRIVAETMAGAARAHATDRGVDHRGLPLLAFGGAGPVHACAVGDLLQSTAVIFPPQASVLSAFGALVTPVRLDLVRSDLGRLDDLDWTEVDRLLAEMTAEALAALGRGRGRAGRGALAGRRRPALRRPAERGRHHLRARPARRPRRRDRSAPPSRPPISPNTSVNPSHVPIEIVSWRLTAQGPENSFKRRRRRSRRRRRAQVRARRSRCGRRRPGPGLRPRVAWRRARSSPARP